MEYLPKLEDQTPGKILCCECGTAISPNPANMCVACLRTQVDITEGIPKQVTVYFCKGCERYLQPPSEWISCSLESRELLSFCLKRLKGLNRVKLVDAGFIWTEPHSKRIKVKLTVHGEVIGGATLQQVFVVEYTVAHQMCKECHRVEAQDYWKCLVQVRQKCDNKKTFYYLEQLILKFKAHENTLGIKPHHEGLDFFFATESHARKMIDFVCSVLPCQSKQSKRLISQDIHSNTYNYKYTWSIKIAPLIKDSVVKLPTSLAKQLGGINSVCLVHRVAGSVHVIDPRTAQVADMNSSVVFRHNFLTMCVPRQLVEFTIIDIELCQQLVKFPGQGHISTKHVLADAWVVKSSELGINQNPVHTKTHLGHILKPGDSVLGYMLADTNINDTNFDDSKVDENTPDVILVKKHYGDRRRHRKWKLKHLEEEATDLKRTGSFDDFMNDLEDDPLLRQNVNIFKDEKRLQEEHNDEDVEPDYPMIKLEEMMDDLVIDEPMDAEIN